MTISKERRLGDQATALRVMAADVGDTMLAAKHWSTNDPRLVNLLPSTWAELQEKGLIQPRKIFGQGPQFHLTESGWIAGLRLNGMFDEPHFRRRCIDLVRFFKSVIDGRREPNDVIVSHHSLPGAGFPIEWVFNVLGASLLQEMFPDKRMNAYWDSRNKVIRVPITFGMPHD